MLRTTFFQFKKNFYKIYICICVYIQKKNLKILSSFFSKASSVI